MLGLSRLAFSLATNRQIPSALGRLHPQRATPFVLIAIAAIVAGALVISDNLDFLFGIFAFGAMLAFTIAHLSICVLRYREPDRPRPYTMPGRDPLRGGVLPLPAALGAVLSGRDGSPWSCCTPARATSGSPGWRPASRSSWSTASARARPWGRA
jgi:APA family basic amino acid/polyamine antiporter